MKCHSDRLLNAILLLLLTASLLGCGAQQVPTVDTSSDDAYTQSLVKMRETLSSEGRNELADSLLVLGLVPRQQNETETDANRRFFQRVDGKNAQEIIAAAKALRSRSGDNAPPQVESPDLSKDSLTHKFALSPFDPNEDIESPEIAVDALGRVYLVWAVRTASGQQIVYLAVSTDRGSTFSEPQVIAKSAIFEADIEVDGEAVRQPVPMQPHVGTAGARVVLGWTQSVADNATVCLVTIESDDGAKTFSRPACVHQSLEASPTFTSLAVAEKRLAFCWLDHRDKVVQPYVAIRELPEGDFVEAPLLPNNAERHFECGPTSIVWGNDDMLYVAIPLTRHDRRDIAIIARSAHTGTLGSPHKVASLDGRADGRSSEAISIAFGGDRLHVAWTDSDGALGRVNYGVADPANMRFETTQIDSDTLASQGRCKLRGDSGGIVHAVWEEEKVDPLVRRCVMYSSEGGPARRFLDATPVDLQPERSQSRPCIAPTIGGYTYMAWNELDGKEKCVVFTRNGYRK